MGDNIAGKFKLFKIKTSACRGLFFLNNDGCSLLNKDAQFRTYASDNNWNFSIWLADGGISRLSVRDWSYGLSYFLKWQCNAKPFLPIFLVIVLTY